MDVIYYRIVAFQLQKDELGAISLDRENQLKVQVIKNVQPLDFTALL